MAAARPPTALRDRRAWFAALLAAATAAGVYVRPSDPTPPTRTDPPPVVVVDPPTRTEPPVVSEKFDGRQFWEHSAYMDAIGNLTMRDCTFGPSWQTKPVTFYSEWDNKSGSYAGQNISKTEWGCWGSTGLAHAVLNLFGPPQQGITFTDCAWLAADDPWDGSPSTMRWGVRGYGMMDVTFDRCSFSRGMAAGTQVALRAGAAYGNITPSGVHTYERCTYVGIGDPRSERWGAFTISEHAPEGYDFSVADVEVRIIDTKLIGGHLDTVDANGMAVKSPRGIMANGRKLVAIDRLHLDYPAPLSGWAIQLWDVPNVRIADSYVREGLVELRNPKTVAISGNSGNAKLVIWTDCTRNAFGQWVGGTKIHDAPISQNYSLND